jgi:hypothetical protein
MDDGLFATSVHGISSSSVGNWQPSLSDSSGGRFSGVRLHQAADEINNKGGGTAKKIFMAQGVYRDQLSLYQAAVRYDDPFAMEMDGDVKSKGRKFFKSRRVPPATRLWPTRAVSRSGAAPEARRLAALGRW